MWYRRSRHPSKTPFLGSLHVLLRICE
jgi:hypothetical protein